MNRIVGGLVKKDLLLVWRYNAKIFMLILLLYTIIPFFSGGDSSQVLLLSNVMCVVFSIFPVTLFSIDETAKWERYALSMPMTRDTIALGKYATSCVLLMIGSGITTFYLITVGFISNRDLLRMIPSAVFSSLLVSLLIVSVLLPFVIRFGAEKARLIFVCAAAFAGGSGVVVQELQRMANKTMLNMILVLTAALVVFCSYLLSVRIYRRKEIE